LCYDQRDKRKNSTLIGVKDSREESLSCQKAMGIANEKKKFSKLKDMVERKDGSYSQRGTLGQYQG